MKIADIMNREVVSLRAKDSIQEAARLMWKSCVSSLPVVDESGSIIGLLTENDLIARLKGRGQPWWQALISDRRGLAGEYQKVTGMTVGEVMSPGPIPVHPDMPIESAARALSQDGIRELPVVMDGRLVGCVSRDDLAKVPATETKRAAEIRADTDLVAEMKARLAQEAWVSNRGIWVDARDGTIALVGVVNSEKEKAALATMAWAIGGCKGLENHLLVKSQLRDYGVA
jgi:CBS-domain-containing membrane protein